MLESFMHIRKATKDDSEECMRLYELDNEKYWEISDFRFWIYDFSCILSLEICHHHQNIRREDCEYSNQAEDLLPEDPTLLVLHPLEEEPREGIN